MSIQPLLGALKARPAGRDRWIARCPAHHDRTPSLAIALAPDNKPLVKCHAGCTQRVVINALRTRGVWPPGGGGASPRVTAPVAAPLKDVPTNSTKMGLRLWAESYPPAGTPVETYLRSRDIWLPWLADGAVLRFHPQVPMQRLDGSYARYPAMVALMRDIRSDEPTGVHRTALRSDGGGKVDDPGLGQPKRMLGRAAGAAIKITPDDEVLEGLAIAEGVETALSLAAIGCEPVWACMSAGGIECFPVLPGVEYLTVYADHDSSGVGQRAAIACASRYLVAGAESDAIVPPTLSQDWNDVLRSRGGAHD